VDNELLERSSRRENVVADSLAIVLERDLIPNQRARGHVFEVGALFEESFE